ncbi:PspC domain-containing protein [Desulfohalovibrio reitneri]|uniref:PspC domain-containing protein n=1 Tax=Desulfohalovibrio reitneri TaxID=1307759 RepID=UPI0004A6E798|nr:PspC domain-containing protein [Desulfohalovibrio reitneri]
MNQEQSNGLYRSRHGRFLGVLKGLAEYFGVSAFWMRVIFVVIALASGVWPAVGAYLIAALLLKPAPAVQPRDEGERDFYDTYAASPRAAMQRLKRKFDSLDRRLRRLEDVATSREYDFDRRLNGSGRH